ncbi:hypothetical protein H4R34_000898 [Dimargaris verticillata]|uniref:Uncharacterized protein n=1 Tax=Dimargaris verticillata TaxID=2761393 RepID=A0A9W8BAV4_9FUNG|nr:hypothetical protein H4R34_000898 [Dimargaris verticillata]
MPDHHRTKRTTQHREKRRGETHPYAPTTPRARRLASSNREYQGSPLRAHTESPGQTVLELLHFVASPFVSRYRQPANTFDVPWHYEPARSSPPPPAAEAPAQRLGESSPPSTPTKTASPLHPRPPTTTPQKAPTDSKAQAAPSPTPVATEPATLPKPIPSPPLTRSRAARSAVSPASKCRPPTPPRKPAQETTPKPVDQLPSPSPAALEPEPETEPTATAQVQATPSPVHRPAQSIGEASLVIAPTQGFSTPRADPLDLDETVLSLPELPKPVTPPDHIVPPRGQSQASTPPRSPHPPRRAPHTPKTELRSNHSPHAETVNRSLAKFFRDKGDVPLTSEELQRCIQVISANTDSNELEPSVAPPPTMAHVGQRTPFQETRQRLSMASQQVRRFEPIHALATPPRQPKVSSSASSAASTRRNSVQSTETAKSASKYSVTSAVILTTKKRKVHQYLGPGFSPQTKPYSPRASRYRGSARAYRTRHGLLGSQAKPLLQSIVSASEHHVAEAAMPAMDRASTFDGASTSPLSQTSMRWNAATPSTSGLEHTPSKDMASATPPSRTARKLMDILGEIPTASSPDNASPLGATSSRLNNLHSTAAPLFRASPVCPPNRPAEGDASKAQPIDRSTPFFKTPLIGMDTLQRHRPQSTAAMLQQTIPKTLQSPSPPMVETTKEPLANAPSHQGQPTSVGAEAEPPVVSLSYSLGQVSRSPHRPQRPEVKPPALPATAATATTLLPATVPSMPLAAPPAPVPAASPPPALPSSTMFSFATPRFDFPSVPPMDSNPLSALVHPAVGLSPAQFSARLAADAQFTPSFDFSSPESAGSSEPGEQSPTDRLKRTPARLPGSPTLQPQQPASQVTVTSSSLTQSPASTGLASPLFTFDQIPAVSASLTASLFLPVELEQAIDDATPSLLSDATTDWSF